MNLHPELQSLLSVWELDLAIDQARGRAEALVADVGTGDVAVAKAEAEVVHLAERRAHLDTEAGELQGRISSYEVRRDRAQRSIDQGTATDFDAVSRQLTQCTQIVDEAELALLENMETLELIEEAQSGAATLAEAAQAFLQQAQAIQRAERPILVARVKEVHPRREAAFLEVNPSHRGPYRTLRAKRRPALAPLLNGACSSCHVASSMQNAIEANQGKRVHRCPGCGAFLLPELPKEEAQG